MAETYLNFDRLRDYFIHPVLLVLVSHTYMTKACFWEPKYHCRWTHTRERWEEKVITSA